MAPDIDRLLRIRVLGGLALEAGGEPRPLPETARGRALLAFCALNPGAHPRARLAAALRPDVLDRSARATLRQAIWALRQAVGEATADAAIVADRDRFGLREDAVWVDLLELRRLAEAAATSRARSSSRPATCCPSSTTSGRSPPAARTTTRSASCSAGAPTRRRPAATSRPRWRGRAGRSSTTRAPSAPRGRS